MGVIGGVDRILHHLIVVCGNISFKSCEIYYDLFSPLLRNDSLVSQFLTSF